MVILNSNLQNENIVKFSDRHNRRSFYSRIDQTLYAIHNAGFCSNLTITLQCIVDLLNQGIIPKEINFSNSFKDYKTPEQLQQKSDVYPCYFKMDRAQDLAIQEELKKNKKILILSHHGIYSNYNYEDYNFIIKKYFNLNEDILEIENNLKLKYNFEGSKTIAVVYRGTDKFHEVKLAEPNLYLKKLKNF